MVDLLSEKELAKAVIVLSLADQADSFFWDKESTFESFCEVLSLDPTYVREEAMKQHGIVTQEQYEDAVHRRNLWRLDVYAFTLDGVRHPMFARAEHPKINRQFSGSERRHHRYKKSGSIF